MSDNTEIYGTSNIDETKGSASDILAKKKKERELKKIKPVSCPFCGRSGLRGIRSLSKHLHVEHDNKSDIEIQKSLVNTIYGNANVKKWLNILADKNNTTEDKKDIPSPVVKLFTLLKKKNLIKLIRKTEKQSSEQRKKLDRLPPLNPMTINAVINKLQLVEENFPIGIYIKHSNNISFLKDVMHYEGIDFSDKNTKGINIVLTKKIDTEKPIGDQLLLSKQLLQFLERPEIDSTELIYIDSSKEGGAKLVKIDDVKNGLIFTFDIDKKYYRELIRNRVRELRKHKKIK